MNNEREISVDWKERALEAEDRLQWLANHLFERKWNAVVGTCHKFNWFVRGDFRHTTQRMIGDTFAEAIDTAKVGT